MTHLYKCRSQVEACTLPVLHRLKETENATPSLRDRQARSNPETFNVFLVCFVGHARLAMKIHLGFPGKAGAVA